jgi:hypothetical protein
LEKLLVDDDPIWVSSETINKNYGKKYYREHIQEIIKTDYQEIENKRLQGIRTKGLTRDVNKRIFNINKDFFSYYFMHWIKNPENSKQIEKFYKDLSIMFKKIAPLRGINPNEWKMNESRVVVEK